MATQIIRGTTPVIEYTFKRVAVSDIATAIVTIKQGTEILIEKDKSQAEVGETTISWKLTQEETLTPNNGSGSIMLNWLLEDGTRGASNNQKVEFVDNHIDEVIE